MLVAWIKAVPFLGVVSAVMSLFFLTGCQKFAATPSATGTPNTKPFVREKFQFVYPSSWKIAEKDEDYDPDHKIHIDGPKDTEFVRIAISDEKEDLAKNLQRRRKAHEKNSEVQFVTFTDFSHWGRYEGLGIKLEGKTKKGLGASARLFEFHAPGKTIAITEYLSEFEHERAAREARTIEDSFEVLK
jgi:hypothetical protein